MGGCGKAGAVGVTDVEQSIPLFPEEKVYGNLGSTLKLQDWQKWDEFPLLLFSQPECSRWIWV